ncbi:hypothetical protein B0H66DRAFT_478826 [Apodospora peruviana]|uniref:Rhodopsin domain-containing protein n=1 Tax=Apodospora peruviana TaxID=516989 RepID=A0AAE0M2Y2_9PEZI|nr:hypothetical protein B0H66DRAFT_478826 [Apodospora peruviana]
MSKKRVNGNDSGEDSRWLLNLAIWILAASSATFLCLRLWCKFRRHRKLWWDDYFLIVSWISLLLSCTMQSTDTLLGFASRNHEIKPGDLDTIRLISLIAGFFLILASGWSKTSFAITLLRLVVQPAVHKSDWVKRFLWFVIVTTNLAVGVSGFFQWVQCTPFDKLWRHSLEGDCLPKNTINTYNICAAAYAGATDVILATVLPAKILWTLRMRDKREKIGTIVAMGMGVL